MKEWFDGLEERVLIVGVKEVKEKWISVGERDKEIGKLYELWV